MEYFSKIKNKYKKFINFMFREDLNFVKAINILNSRGINYWACNGTALGLIRDKNLIPWDLDIDIGIWKNETNILELEQIFKKEGFAKKKKFFHKDNLLSFTRSGGRDVDFNIHELCDDKNMCISKYYVHRNVLMRLIYVLSLAGNYKGNYKILINRFFFLKNLFLKLKEFLIIKNIFYKKGGYTVPTKLFKSFKILSVNGLKVIIPYYCINYLIYLYGKNWKIPVKNYNWEKNKNFASNK